MSLNIHRRVDSIFVLERQIFHGAPCKILGILAAPATQKAVEILCHEMFKGIACRTRTACGLRGKKVRQSIDMLLNSKGHFLIVALVVEP